MPPEDDSLRDTITTAVESSESASPPASTPAAPSAPPGSPGGEAGARAPSAPAAAPESKAPAPSAPSAQPRDATGRFTPKPADALPPASATDAHPKPGTPPAKGETPGAPEPGTKALRPPATWKPEHREEWAKLPPALQGEILRREHETMRSMQDYATVKNALGAMRETLAPFMSNIRAANGGDVVSAVRELFGADHTLRHGSPADKAALVARLINGYRVDIELLDKTLAGQPVHSAPENALIQQLRAEVAQQLQPLTERFANQQREEQRQMRALQVSANNDVQEFGDDEQHEYFNDVREEMADLMEVAARRGIAMSLQEAYDRAIALHPKLAEIVAARAGSERAAAAAEAAQRARRAAASLPSGGAPAGSPGDGADPNNLRQTIANAFAAHEGRA